MKKILALLLTDCTITDDMTLAEHAENGQKNFYLIYSEEEMNADPSKRNTGLFFFKG